MHRHTSKIPKLIQSYGLVLMMCWGTASAATLSEVVGQVLREHPNVQASRALLDAADEQLKQARSNYYPVVGVESYVKDGKDKQSSVFGNTIVDRATNHTEAYLRWNIFRGLSDKKAVNSSEFKRKAADADLAETHEQVALQVAENYLELLRMRRLMALTESYIKDLEQLAEMMKAREEAGRVSAADMDQVRMTLIQVASQQSQLRGQLRGLEQRYTLLVGAAPGELVEPNIDDTAATLAQDALNERVLEKNRSVRAAMERAAAQAEDVGVANGALFPSLDVELRKRLHTKDNPAWVTDTQRSAQLTLNYQMPLGGANFSRKREAEDRRVAAQAAAETELLRVRTELATRWASWQEMRNLAPQLQQRIEAGKRIIDAYDAQYEAARRSLLDLISSRSEYFRAQAELISNRMDQALTSAQVLSLLGELRETLLNDKTPDVSKVRKSSVMVDEISLGEKDFITTTPIPKADVPAPVMAPAVTPNVVPAAQPTEITLPSIEEPVAKPVEAKPLESKPDETKNTESKPVEAKPVEAKPADSGPADAAPAELDMNAIPLESGAVRGRKSGVKAESLSSTRATLDVLDKNKIPEGQTAASQSSLVRSPVKVLRNSPVTGVAVMRSARESSVPGVAVAPTQP